MIEIHKDAEANFDAKGESLISLIEEISQKSQSDKNFPSELHVKQHVTEKDIIEYHPSIISNGYGEEIGFYFFHERKRYGILDENYKIILKLVESISKQSDLSSKVSQETIKNTIFDWIKKRCIGVMNQDLTTFIIDQASAKISVKEIWLPIRFLQIEETFIVGRISFKTISKKMIENLLAQCIEDRPEKETEFKEMFEKHIRKFQGYAAATLLIEAESNRADEICLEETRKAVSLLRIFHPASFHPKVTSSYNIWGSELNDRASILLLEEGKFFYLNDRPLGKSRSIERIDKETIKVSMEAGLKILSDLLVSKTLSQFQKIVLDALFIYARSATAKDPADKLVYILVALESLFLRNNTEPIQQNLAERIAFLIEGTIESRRKLIRDVREVYTIRSSFVHHGATIDDFDTLSRFMLHAWRAITAIISATVTISTKDEFIDQLDNRKLA